MRPEPVEGHSGRMSGAETLSCGVVTVVPVTSNMARVLVFQTLLEARTAGSAPRVQSRRNKPDPLAFDPRATHRTTAAGPGCELDEALRLHLGLWALPGFSA
jgi:mRNA interferase MazF